MGSELVDWDGLGGGILADAFTSLCLFLIMVFLFLVDMSSGLVSVKDGVGMVGEVVTPG